MCQHFVDSVQSALSVETLILEPELGFERFVQKSWKINLYLTLPTYWALFLFKQLPYGAQAGIKFRILLPLPSPVHKITNVSLAVSPLKQRFSV